MSSSSQQHRPLPPTAAAVTAAFDPSSTAASNSRTTTAGAASSVDHRDVASRGFSAAAPASTSPLAGIKVKLRAGLRQFPDFPSPGILFEDIMPLFADPALHADLITALELQVKDSFGAAGAAPIDIVVGLESRGFLFGPTLAARLGAGFVPVRKQGKLPGPCETATYTKEYGSDNFQMQTGAIRAGQRVLIVDDIIATGGSAAAAGSLVRKLGGDLVGYLFLMELDFLKGRAKLDAPVFTLLTGQEEALAK